MTHTRFSPIAVVGASALFPGSSDIEGFWRDIVRGADRITDVPATHWLPEDYHDPDPAAPDRTYCRRGAFLSPVPFDPLEFGVPPTIVPATDTAQLLALLVARAALQDWRDGPLAPETRARTSVILGVTSGQELLGTMVSRLQRPVWTKALRELGWPEDQVQAACKKIADHYVPWVESTFPGLLGNVVAGRIANRFDLGGSNLVTDAACASTLAAVHAAIHELHAGDADVALTGGVDTSNDIFMFTCFSKTPALSPTGDCRPFSAAADGTMLGEGLGMLVLRRLADAERDGDRIHAVIRGVGTSSDGRARSIYAPVSDGQARALRRAYAAADIDPATVELLEAHGTGTVAGDLAEFRGLTQVFTAEGRAQPCALGSIKSQIGHTKAAAGAAGLLKAILAVSHAALPPTIKVERPDPRLDIDASPFYLNTTARPWISRGPRRAGVSSFGFGGTNFHVVVEQYVGPAPKAMCHNARPGELALLSSGTPAGLAAACRELARAPGSLPWLARGSQQRFDPAAAVRLAVVARDLTELATALDAAADALAGGRPPPPGVRVELAPAAPGGLALACPGQGSQYVGMGAALALHFEPARRAWDEAITCLSGHVPLHDVAFPPAAFGDAARERQTARLTATEWAQPALAAAGAAALALLRACGVRPDAAFGHSFGELTALHAAGVFDLPTLLRAARRRGERMRDAAAVPGAMSAVTGSTDQVAPILAAHPDVVLANLNAPRQVVVAGPTDAVERVEAALRAAGLPVRRLAVATAFHSPLVAPASEAFAADLADLPLASPGLPVLSCSELAVYPDDPATARAWLARQLVRPVRFVDQVEALHARGIRTFIELGPGSVLTGLVARCLEGRPHRAVSLDDRGGDGVLAFLRALGELALAGHRLDLAPLWDGLAPPRAPEPASARLTLQLCGANYGKPYPPPGGAAALPPPNPPGDRASPPGHVARDMSPRTSPGAAPPPPLPGRIVESSSAPAPRTSAGEFVTRAGPGAHDLLEPAAPPRAVPAVPDPSLAFTTPMTARTPVPAQSPAWLDAHREIFGQLAAAQAAYQRAMADTHLAYLQVAHASLTALHGGATPPLSLAHSPAMTPVDPSAASPGLPDMSSGPGSPPPSRPPTASLPAPAPREARHAPPAPASLPDSDPRDIGHAPAAPPSLTDPPLARGDVRRAPAAPPAPVALPDHAPARPAGTAPAGDPAALLLSVVADKTGYPADMLRLDMALESDLGVDSIKRVEILSALRERFPALPDLPPSALGDLRTLGDIAGLLRQEAALPAATPPIDPTALLMAVVADKTGYPADMLRLGMALESDLGIDSIKRVEILSALRERFPALPDLPPSALGDLRTLGDVAALLSPGTADAPRPAPAEPEPHAVAALLSPGTADAPRPAPVAPEARAAAAPIDRHVPRLVAAAPAGFRLPRMDRGRVVVTDEGGGIGAALVADLRARDLDAVLVDDPGRLPADACALIVLDGLRPGDDLDAGLHACRRTLAFARAFAPRALRGDAVFVTVQDTGGRFGLAGAVQRPGHAGLAAFARTAAREWPATVCRAIDLERAGRPIAQVAQDLTRELLAGGLELEVALPADGTRWTVAAEREPAGLSAPLVVDGVWVVTGGARGITPGLAEALVGRGVRKLLLLGRTEVADDPHPGVDGQALTRALLAADGAQTPAALREQVQRIERAREVRRTLARLAAAGADVRYAVVDLLDRPALSAALADVRAAWGPIGALVHAAGVLADRSIADKTDADFDRVLATKIDGLRALLDATADDPVHTLLLFSSIAARTGNPGQCDYAAANEILNKLAWAERARRGDACRVKALGWGPWRGGMVTPELARVFTGRGVPLIEPEHGAELLLAELTRAPAADVEVVLGALGHDLSDMSPRTEAELHLDGAAAPDLGDHAPAGVPVVPIALAVEWFARAAAAVRPGRALVEVRHLQVLRGLKLPRLHLGGHRLRLTLSPNPGGSLTAIVSDEAGAAALRADLICGPRRALPAAQAPLGPPATYAGPLFHGPAFRVLGRPERLDAGRAIAPVVGVLAQGWPGPFASDPAALDGALQLALLWLERASGGRSLPMAIDRIDLHAAGPWPTPARCDLRAASHDRSRGTCSVDLTSPDGRPLAALHGVELIVFDAEGPAAGGAGHG